MQKKRETGNSPWTEAEEEFLLARLAARLTEAISPLEFYRLFGRGITCGVYDRAFLRRLLASIARPVDVKRE